MKITIIGAGIGGLTTAIALKQQGFEIEIFEASPVFKKAGSGINLALNAMQVYKKLGIYTNILNAGNINNSMVIRTEKGAVLSAINTKLFEEKFNVKSVAIHRATLHKILLAQLSDVPLYLNKKIKTLKQSEKGIELNFEDGTSHKASILIAADGIHSVIRKSIFKNTIIRKAKQVCFRGITKIELPKKYQTELNELWGKGKRFGFVAIAKNEYYWFALADYKENYIKEFKNIDLISFYTDFDPIVGQIITATSKENILTNEMLDLKPISTWHQKNICLLGDSAHATTPNLGQGACQAIESSYALASCFAKYKNPEKAFTKFENIRMKKAISVVNTSWKIGKIAHLENVFLIKIRDFILKNTPEKISNKQSEKIFTLIE